MNGDIIVQYLDMKFYKLQGVQEWIGLEIIKCIKNLKYVQ
jgi:hypothetical protein